MSADTALLFEALTGWDAQIGLSLQAKWDLWHAVRARGQRPKVRSLRGRPERRAPGLSTRLDDTIPVARQSGCSGSFVSPRATEQRGLISQRLLISAWQTAARRLGPTVRCHQACG
jgi:hypothetical protein